jgi:DNA (cytosine-5)-methyltransferase 1
MQNYIAIDLFSGCGGLSEGLRQAGFNVLAAVESDKKVVECYHQNHPETELINKDIREVEISDIEKVLGNRKLHLLAGCPPCQGFSSVRRLNRLKSVKDKRNSLILEFLRCVKGLKPLTIMMENVPALENYYKFKYLCKSLESLKYKIDYDVINVVEYGVPQKRKRLVLIGSLLDDIKIAEGTNTLKSVRDAIGNIESVKTTLDPLHKIVAKHSDRISNMIRLIPKDGGSRRDLPDEYILDCHRKKNVGFNDIYGRLKWDVPSSTITGGCLNPSKGRFLHPEEDRVITPREASLLQSFPENYYFPHDVEKEDLSRWIGNALPPTFSKVQSLHILNHIKQHSK